MTYGDGRYITEMTHLDDPRRDSVISPQSGPFGGEKLLAVDVARRAAEVVFTIDRGDSTFMRSKSDGSPVT